MLAPIRCLYWNGRLSTLAVGQNPHLSFYLLDPQKVLAHRRARNRQMNISGSNAVPEPVWLREAHRHHYGSYKLARIKLAQEEGLQATDPGLSKVRSHLQNHRAPAQQRYSTFYSVSCCCQGSAAAAAATAAHVSNAVAARNAAEHSKARGVSRRRC
jgi:hypothetical protein